MTIRLTPPAWSPARMVEATGAAPRWRGSSDGWTFSGGRSPIASRSSGTSWP